MFSKFIIIFLICLPLSEGFAAQSEADLEIERSNSNLYYNLSLKNFKSNDLGLAKAYIERSLYLNPLSSDSRTLNAQISQKLIDVPGARHQEEISGFSRALDFIPAFIPYVFLIIALFLVSLSFAQLTFSEKSSFKENPHLRLRTIGFIFLLACTLLLFFTKEISSTKNWACITSTEARLFTGPQSKNYVQTGSLQIGSCVEVVRVLKDWISLKPNYSPSGWVNRSDTMLVRGYKIDPPRNND